MLSSSQNYQQSNLSGFDDEIQESLPISQKFCEKHVYSLKNNPMCGVTLTQWIRIAGSMMRYIDLKYIPRAIFITFLSIVNTLLAIVEYFFYQSKINNVTLRDDPIFIVGHPRTGTTLLHNLLAMDERHFFFCTTFCAGFPSSFLWFETIGKRLFAGIIEKTRPMDSMPLHFDLPQEDECAVNLLSGGRSYYMPLWFMAQETKFRKYLDFSEDEGGCSKDECLWSISFIHLMKKLTLRSQMLSERDGTDHSLKRLLIKSPIHTARIPLLRRLFPQATFIYIHRDPYAVYKSAVHMADTAYWFCYLNTPTDQQILEFIMWQFDHMFRKYAAAAYDSTGALSPDILEISYESLANPKNTMNTLKKIYEHIGVPWNDHIDQCYGKEIENLSGYRPNVLRGLSEELKSYIYSRWKNYFIRFKYGAS